jgi:hypothetical protein
MVSVAMRDEEPVNVVRGSADAFQGRFECRKRLRRVETRVEKGQAAVMERGIDVDMLEPERHGQGDHIKIARYFFYQDAAPVWTIDDPFQALFSFYFKVKITDQIGP